MKDSPVYDESFLIENDVQEAEDFEMVPGKCYF